MQDKNIRQRIFNIKTQEEFRDIALNVFRIQSKNNPVYKEYINLLEVDSSKINSLEQIPFLPICFFKSKEIICNNVYNNAIETKQIIFTSSSTGGTVPSKHYVSDVSVYKDSFIKSFNIFYGNPKEYTILALLPSYLERQGSSLVYMANELINISLEENSKSGFYLYNFKELHDTLNYLKDNRKKTILLGVTFALLDFLDNYSIDYKDLIIMETGGMKGRGIEMDRKTLHNKLRAGFGTYNIHSEYGMAELLSQAYSKTEGVFKSPPWMQIMVRNLQNPFSYYTTSNNNHPFAKSTALGGINIIDLANINSCSFIETEDMAYLFNPGELSSLFTVEGRLKEAEMRGCNLLLHNV